MVVSRKIYLFTIFRNLFINTSYFSFIEQFSLYEVVFSKSSVRKSLYTYNNLLRAFFFLDYLKTNYQKYIQTVNISSNGVLTFVLKHAKDLYTFVLLLKTDNFCYFTTLIDLWAVEFISRPKFLNVNYLFHSMRFDVRLYVNLFVTNWICVPSISELFASVSWLEREVWDMHGIIFSGNGDLRRILTDYGFMGHPLRKSFPLTGYFEMKYDEMSRRVVSESLNFIQEFRVFSFTMPWISV